MERMTFGRICASIVVEDSEDVLKSFRQAAAVAA